MLSIVSHARNDDYGGGFIERFHESVRNNLILLDNGFDYEYIIVEWMPTAEYLKTYSKTSDLYTHPKVRSIVVDSSIAAAEGLPPNIYFEYFAKNVGIRRAKGENILIINSDILLSTHMLQEIQRLETQKVDPKKFYRPRYRYNLFNKTCVNEKRDLHEPHNPDACICGPYSGDFLFATKQTVVESGRGYNEQDEAHRKTYQSGMDGEILWNMYHHGIRMEFLDSYYYHYNHGHPHTHDGVYRDVKYDNKPDWGLVSYPSKIIDGVEIIYAKFDKPL